MAVQAQKMSERQQYVYQTDSFLKTNLNMTEYDLTAWLFLR